MAIPMLHTREPNFSHFIKRNAQMRGKYFERKHLIWIAVLLAVSLDKATYEWSDFTTEKRQRRKAA